MNVFDVLDTVLSVSAILMSIWALIDGRALAEQIVSLANRIRAVDVVTRSRIDAVSASIESTPRDDARVAAAVRDLSRAMRSPTKKGVRR